MVTRPHHRTLTAQVRNWSAEQVATLLRRRPDLAAPPPDDLAGLAQRAQYQPSIVAAIDTTTLAENRLLQLVICCRPAAPLSELAAALPDGTSVDDVEPVLASLEEAALLWRHDGRVHTSGVLRQIMPTPFGPPLQALATERQTSELKSMIAALHDSAAASSPAGELPAPATGPDGRPPRKADLVDELERYVVAPGVVAAVLETAPDEVAALAESLANGDPYVEWSYYWSYSGAVHRAGPEQWLHRHGLLLPVPHTMVAALPREVAVAVRGGRPLVDLALARPLIASHRVDQDVVDRHGAGRAMRTLDQLAELLDGWRQVPAKALQSGGLGVAVVRQVAACSTSSSPTPSC